jgi:hypothetical protein
MIAFRDRFAVKIGRMNVRHVKDKDTGRSTMCVMLALSSASSSRQVHSSQRVSGIRATAKTTWIRLSNDRATGMIETTGAVGWKESFLADRVETKCWMLNNAQSQMLTSACEVSMHQGGRLLIVDNRWETAVLHQQMQNKAVSEYFSLVFNC